MKVQDILKTKEDYVPVAAMDANGFPTTPNDPRATRFSLLAAIKKAYPETWFTVRNRVVQYLRDTGQVEKTSSTTWDWAFHAEWTEVKKLIDDLDI